MAPWKVPRPWLTFYLLENLARELDMGSEFAKQFQVNAEMSMSVIQLVTNAHAENQQAAPGISLVKALAALLASGAAHVISGDDRHGLQSKAPSSPKPWSTTGTVGLSVAAETEAAALRHEHRHRRDSQGP